MYYIYVIFSQSIGKYYVGHTSDIKRRIDHHNKGLNRWSKRGIPWRIVFTEKFKSKSEAIKREYFLKSGKGRELYKGRLSI